MTTVAVVARHALALAASVRITLTADALRVELAIPRKDPSA